MTASADGTPLVVVPLRSHLAPVTALVAVAHPGSGLLDVEERDLLAGFADQVALSLDRTQALADRQELALISDRERIARDLHDIVIQRLFATGLQLQGVAAMAGGSAVARAARQVRGRPRRHDQGDPRHDLRAPGPTAATRCAPPIRKLVKEYVPVLGFTPVVRTSGPVDTAVPHALGAQLLAVLREAISNVARHALADGAEVDVVVTGDRLELRVADDGVGLPAEVAESGLRNARRRADDLGGTLEVSRVGERGTVARVAGPAALTSTRPGRARQAGTRPHARGPDAEGRRRVR